MMYHQFSIRISNACKKALIQKLAAWGCLGMIEQNESITAYFPESADICLINREFSIIKSLFEKAGHKLELTVDYITIPEEDWNESWKRNLQPIDIGDRFTVVPPWRERRKNRINLVIDPAMAFGTGHHATTKSCLELMERYGNQSRKERFLDLGTGTGILAIAAIHLGYQRVVAVDTDPRAVDAAQKNAVRNQVKGIETLRGTLENLNETYDFITANIISGILVLIAPALAARLNPGGIAILSGILMGQELEVMEAISQAGLQLIEQYRDEKWISLVVGR